MLKSMLEKSDFTDIVLIEVTPYLKKPSPQKSPITIRFSRGVEPSQHLP